MASSIQTPSLVPLVPVPVPGLVPVPGPGLVPVPVPGLGLVPGLVPVPGLVQHTLPAREAPPVLPVNKWPPVTWLVFCFSSYILLIGF